MTNNIVAIDFNGVKVILDSNTKLVHLSSSEFSGNNTFHDSEDGADYQVPTGKKFTIIYIEDSGNLNTGGEEIFYADDADGTTNKVTLRDFAGGAVTNQIFISAEVPADKYVTQTGNSSGNTVLIQGIEEDA